MCEFIGPFICFVSCLCERRNKSIHNHKTHTKGLCQSCFVVFYFLATGIINERNAHLKFKKKKKKKEDLSNLSSGIFSCHRHTVMIRLGFWPGMVARNVLEKKIPTKRPISVENAGLFLFDVCVRERQRQERDSHPDLPCPTPTILVSFRPFGGGGGGGLGLQ